MSHANVDARTGWLDYLIATPHVHHFHHSLRPEEARNYGTNVMIWDLLFGTYYLPDRWPAAYGLSAPRDVPGRWFSQLTYPFRRRKV